MYALMFYLALVNFFLPRKIKVKKTIGYVCAGVSAVILVYWASTWIVYWNPGIIERIVSFLIKSNPFYWATRWLYRLVGANAGKFYYKTGGAYLYKTLGIVLNIIEVGLQILFAWLSTRFDALHLKESIEAYKLEKENKSEEVAENQEGNNETAGEGATENAAEASAESSETIETPESYFDGGLLQQIGYGFLGFLITILTVGICYPVAFTMLYRWEAKHTVINGKRLKFDGTALQLFGNWIKWFLLFIITLGIFGFWLPIKLKKWKTKHTSFAE